MQRRDDKTITLIVYQFLFQIKKNSLDIPTANRFIQGVCLLAEYQIFYSRGE